MFVNFGCPSCTDACIPIQPEQMQNWLVFNLHRLRFTMSRLQHASENTLQMDKHLETVMSVRLYVHFLWTQLVPGFWSDLDIILKECFSSYDHVHIVRVLWFIPALWKREGGGGFVLQFIFFYWFLLNNWTYLNGSGWNFHRPCNQVHAYCQSFVIYCSVLEKWGGGGGGGFSLNSNCVRMCILPFLVNATPHTFLDGFV